MVEPFRDGLLVLYARDGHRVYVREDELPELVLTLARYMPRAHLESCPCCLQAMPRGAVKEAE